MTDLYATIRAHVAAALRAAVPGLPDDVAARLEVTPTKDPAHGDLATNAAMVAAKPARLPPTKIAALLAEHLAQATEIASATPAGPGFVNIRLTPEALRATLPTILRKREAYGDSTLGAGTPVNVEYVSANPTGPMHVGHCRGAVVGDALANLLKKAGYQVTKEYYINDAGAQVQALAYAAYWRYLQTLGTPLTEDEYAAQAPGGLQYKGDYLIPVGEALQAAHGNTLAAPGNTPAPPDLWLAPVQDTAIAMMLASIKTDLAALGVTPDVWTSERALVAAGAPDATIARLQAQGLIYEGTLPPPKGKLPEDWEPREQTLFRATQFGDDVDRPLRKSDGSNTYFANDIAYHADKMARGATQVPGFMIDVWGADHGGYVSRMKSAVKALAGNGAQTLDIVLCQIVHVLRGGQPVRMSKRAGTYVTLSDLLEWVGRDAVRFTMLTRKSDAQMEFDLDLAVSQTRENPVWYVQYAHARCRSVLRTAKETGHDTTPEALATADLTPLATDAELAMVLRLAAWPRTVEAAALAHEPHRIAFFLYDLAADFNTLWSRGNADSTLRFLQADQPRATRARLALVEATATTIRSALAVLGVHPLEELR